MEMTQKYISQDAQGNIAVQVVARFAHVLRADAYDAPESFTDAVIAYKQLVSQAYATHAHASCAALFDADDSATLGGLYQRAVDDTMTTSLLVSPDNGLPYGAHIAVDTRDVVRAFDASVQAHYGMTLSDLETSRGFTRQPVR